MPGAWEFGPPSVLCAILTGKEVVSTNWAMSFRNLQLPGDGSTPIFLSGMTYDHGRNHAAKLCLESTFQWLMFLDDDVVVPADVFHRLAGRGLDIISGLYYRRHPPIDAMMLKDTDKGPAWIKEFRMGDLLDVDYVGGGCLLIHRRVLQALKGPLKGRGFRWRLEDGVEDDVFPGLKLSEDFWFCKAARVVGGFKIHMDTSVVCEHVGMGKAVFPGSFIPASTP